MEIESLGKNHFVGNQENRGFEGAVAIVGKKAVHLAEDFGDTRGSSGMCWKEGTEVQRAGLAPALEAGKEERASLQILVPLAAQEETRLSLQQRSQHLQLPAVEGWEETVEQG